MIVVCETCEKKGKGWEPLARIGTHINISPALTFLNRSRWTEFPTTPILGYLHNLPYLKKCVVFTTLLDTF